MNLQYTNITAHVKKYGEDLSFDISTKTSGSKIIG